MADTPKLPKPKFPLPGRLGDESMTLFTDPRADPRMLAAMSSLGMDQPQPDPPVNGKSDLFQPPARPDCADTNPWL